MRYFRTESDELYDGIRLQLDAAWGLPNSLGTVTCIEPAATAPRDSEGRIVLAVDDEFAEFDAVQAVLPGLLQAGLVVEIDRDAYMAAVAMEEP